VTRYLTPEQVLFIHSRLIHETGGQTGLRDLSMLLSAVGRPQTTFDADDLYPDVFEKAAALFDSLIRNHPFIDGNKRTAITAAGLFLQMNGQQMVVDDPEMVRFTLACAQSLVGLEEISVWLRLYSHQV
jgi:death-on-curing protein